MQINVRSRRFAFKKAASLASGVMLSVPCATYGQAARQPYVPATSLPASPPTTSPNLLQNIPTFQRADSVPLSSPKRGLITWQGGQLTIVAENASLNQTLRDVAQRTGMKVVGGVREERVFGTYGPGPAAGVLRQLLDGTSSNMLLQMDGAAMPVLLTLSPRTGGVTPPNTMSAQDDDGSQNNGADASGQPAPQQPPRPPVVSGRGPMIPPQQSPDGSQNNGAAAPILPPAGSDGTDPAADTGPRTAQQIYEQLQRLQQKRQQSAPN